MSKNQFLDLNELKTDLVSGLTREFFRILEVESADHGRDFADEVLYSIIASLISTKIYNALSRPVVPESDDPPHSDQSRQEDQACDSYVVAREAIQEAVANGFSGGFLYWNPDSLAEFYCMVRPVGKPVNRLPL